MERNDYSSSNLFHGNMKQCSGSEHAVLRDSLITDTNVVLSIIHVELSCSIVVLI